VLSLVAVLYSCGYFQLSYWIPAFVGYVMLHSHWNAVEDARSALDAKYADYENHPELVQHLMRGSVPKWIKFGEWEKVRFLNEAVRIFWPFLSAAVEQSIRDNLGPLLKDIKPVFLSKLELGVVTLGEVPLRILSVKVLCADEADDEVIWDLQLEAVSTGDDEKGGAAIGFSAGSKLVSLSATLREVQIKGTLRIIFGHLLKEWPLFQTIRVAFIEAPTLKYKIKAGKVPMHHIPGFEGWLTDLIQNSLSEMLVWPNELVVPLWYDDEFPDPMALDEFGDIDGHGYGDEEMLRRRRGDGHGQRIATAKQPKGVLTVRIIEAKNLQNKDLFGKSDPMASVWIGAANARRDPKRRRALSVFKTRKIQSTLNPVWDEVFELTVFKKETERLHVAVENINFGVGVFNKNEDLGDVTIDLEALKAHTTHTQWYRLKNIRSGSIHIELFYRPLLTLQNLTSSTAAVGGGVGAVSSREITPPPNANQTQNFQSQQIANALPGTPASVSKSFALALGQSPSASDDNENVNGIAGGFDCAPMMSPLADVAELPELSRSITSLRKLPKVNSAKMPKIQNANEGGPTSPAPSSSKKPKTIKERRHFKIPAMQLQLQREKGSPDIERTFDAILRVRVLSAAQLKAGNRDGTSDPFVMLRLGERIKLKTSILRKTTQPQWNEEFQLKLQAEEIQHGVLEFTVKDYDKWTKNSVLGTLSIYVSDLLKADVVVNKQYSLSPSGTLQLEMELLSVYSKLEIEKKNNSGKEPNEWSNTSHSSH